MQMLQIIINSEADTMFFCHRLTQNEFSFEVSEQDADATVIQLKLTESRSREIADVLLELWIMRSERKTIIEVISNYYYYKDPQEIDHILEIMYDRVMTTQYQERFGLMEVREELLQQLLHNMESEYFHYSMFVEEHHDFFYNLIISEVGFAIDEIKQEEQYQQFIQSIRDYVANQTNNLHVLHVIQGKPFTFYRDDGYKYSVKDLQNIIQKKPLYIVGLDESELNITPIIALLPAYIYLYGRDPADAKTIAVQNIFQDRVIYKNIQAFPFSHVE